MSKKVIIAVDAMGGDHGVEATVPAALMVLRKHKNLSLVLVGDEEKIKEQIGNNSKYIKSKRLTIKHTTQEVEMGELPSKALRYKKDSSMRVAINMVKDNSVQACVSAGNTGALMAIAKFVLKTLPGIDRPAIVAALPTYIPGKDVRMLDLGANVDSCADHLYQFAVMGSVLMSAVNDIKHPKIGLLNIGEEEIKGNDQVKHTAQLLSESKDINYVGYIEGDDVFKGEVDVVVCDGFVGNVALKTIEGVMKLLARYTKRIFLANWYSKVIACFATPMLSKLKKTLDPGRYNGASLIGLRGIVIKSHGGADSKSFACAIEEAIIEVEKNIPKRIGEQVGIVLEGG